jgi:cobalamin biosynthesis Mg chelatase CobN
VRIVRTVRDIHRDAMEVADEAEAAKKAKDYENARKFFRQALALERQAANSLLNDLEAEPTRSVLFRSAASLAMDCGEYREAERLASTALAGNPPDDIADELRDLLEQANYQRHFDVRGAYLEAADTQFSMTGKAVGFGVVRSDEFIPRVEALNKIVLRTAERLIGKPFRNHGRVSKEISDHYGFALTMARGGSFAVSFRVEPVGQQLTLPGMEEVPDPTNIMQEVMDCFDLLAELNEDALSRRIPDNDYYTNFVGLARQMAPDGKNIDAVFLTTPGADGLRRVRMTQAVNNISLVNKLLPPKEAPALADVSSKIVGELKAANSLDEAKNTITVLDKSSGRRRQLRLIVSEGIADIVRPLYEDEVEVEFVTRGRKRYLTNIKRVTEESSDLVEQTV